MKLRGMEPLLLRYVGASFGRFGSHRQIRLVWPDGHVPLKPRVALFCHHHAAGRIRQDSLRYLRELRDAGFSVVLVSNSAVLQPEALAAVRPLCAAVLVRNNLGLDFCAWRDAMEHLRLPRPDTAQLLLANDSVYGPLRPLQPLLARIAEAPGLWSMTDSTERGFHLQSYFLLAQADVLHSAAWRRFWRGVRPLRWKWLLIGVYEVGLTQRLLRAGLSCRALFGGADGPAGSNPTLAGWRALLDAGFPFIKRELLRDNPTAVSDLACWRGRVAELAGAAAVEAIEQDLAQYRT